MELCSTRLVSISGGGLMLEDDLVMCWVEMKLNVQAFCEVCTQHSRKMAGSHDNSVVQSQCELSTNSPSLHTPSNRCTTVKGVNTCSRTSTLVVVCRTLA